LERATRSPCSPSAAKRSISAFQAPNDQWKASTPPVSDPNYDQDIPAFVAANVPNAFAGQPVNFYDYFNSQGALTIWGAPISMPAPDPNNHLPALPARDHAVHPWHRHILSSCVTVDV
jgi:hypothetical protein